MQKHSVDFKVSAVLQLTEVREAKSVMPITASVGEDGLATALIVAHLRHVVPQTDTARDFTNELLPYLWRF